MNASQIARKTGLLKGTVRTRLRKLGYNTGKGIDYEPEALLKVKNFKYPDRQSKNHFMEAEVYFYWLTNKENSCSDISKALNIPTNAVNHILNKIFKKGYVIAESKSNFWDDSRLT